MPYRASSHPHPVLPASLSATALEGKPRNHPGEIFPQRVQSAESVEDNKCPPAPLPLPAPPREALFRLGNAFTCVARASSPQQGIKGGDRSAGWPGAGSGQREEGAAGGRGSGRDAARSARHRSGRGKGTAASRLKAPAQPEPPDLFPAAAIIYS